MHDLFVSYPHADRDAVVPLVDRMRKDGLSVWFDEDRIAPFSGITPEVRSGIEESRIFVVYYSQNYRQSRACQWELTHAIAAMSPADVAKRVLVLNPENRIDHVSPAVLRDQLQPASADSNEQVALAAIALKERLAEIEGPIGPPNHDPGTWTGWTPVRSSRFFGRSEELWQIHSLLHADESALSAELPNVTPAIIQGMAGVGKTLLAEQYAILFGGFSPSAVIWLTAHASADPPRPEVMEGHRSAQLRLTLRSLGDTNTYASDSAVQNALASRMRSNPRSYLWVVDDVPAGLSGDQLKRWLPSLSTVPVLITTRE